MYGYCVYVYIRVSVCICADMRVKLDHQGGASERSQCELCDSHDINSSSQEWNAHLRP